MSSKHMPGDICRMKRVGSGPNSFQTVRHSLTFSDNAIFPTP